MQKLERLTQYLESKQDTKFEWGVNDCVMFAANAVKAMVGVDLAKAYRDLYSNKKEAYKIINKGGNLLELTDEVCKYYNFNRRIYPLKAQRGDLVMVVTTLGDTMGIVSENGDDVYVVDEIGYRKLPFRSIKYCWEVIPCL